MFLCYVRKRSDNFSRKGIQGVVGGYDDMGYRVLVNDNVMVTQNIQTIDMNSNCIVT